MQTVRVSTVLFPVFKSSVPLATHKSMHLEYLSKLAFGIGQFVFCRFQLQTSKRRALRRRHKRRCSRHNFLSGQPDT